MAYSAKTGAVKSGQSAVVILIASVAAQVLTQVAQQAGVTIDDAQLTVAFTVGIGTLSAFISNWIKNRKKK